MRVQVVPFDRHTQGSMIAFLSRITPHESRRFAASHLGVDLCEAWLGVGWCCRVGGHEGGCIALPADYAPRSAS